MVSKQAKNLRTLKMFARLCEGKSIDKSEMAGEYCVDERTIQRDLDDIRTFLAEESTENSADYRTVVYDRKDKVYFLEGSEGSFMSYAEILAVSKILLESRAFTGNEMNGILEKMIKGCVPEKNRKLINDLIANERHHFVELNHGSYLQDRLWELGTDVKKSKVLKITYLRQGDREDKVKRLVIPVGILFSEYYFYLSAFILEKNEKDKLEKKYDYPAIFRVDRLEDCEETGYSFSIPYSDRFEEGEFRKRIQFMYSGPLKKVEFFFWGKNTEAVIDRLPTAEIFPTEEENKYLVKAEVYGNGIIMWLLSQGDKVELLKPVELREEMKRTVSEMMKKYSRE